LFTLAMKRFLLQSWNMSASLNFRQKVDSCLWCTLGKAKRVKWQRDRESRASERARNGWSVHGSKPQADLTFSQLEPSPLYLDPSSSSTSSFSYPTHLPPTLYFIHPPDFSYFYLWMDPAWKFLVSSPCDGPRPSEVDQLHCPAA
jgi:hypothetical protein